LFIFFDLDEQINVNIITWCILGFLGAQPVIFPYLFLTQFIAFVAIFDYLFVEEKHVEI
jgi:hypothetical protein